MKAKPGGKPIKFYVVLVRATKTRKVIWLGGGLFEMRSQADSALPEARKLFGWAKVVKCEVRA